MDSSSSGSVWQWLAVERREIVADWSRFRAIVSRIVARTWAVRAQLLHVLAIVGGWALVTAGVAALLVPEVWLISGGLFLLSLAGWGHLWRVFSLGLFKLAKLDRQRGQW